MLGSKEIHALEGDELKVVKLYDMLPAEAGDTCEGRTAADNATDTSRTTGCDDPRFQDLLRRMNLEP